LTEDLFDLNAVEFAPHHRTHVEQNTFDDLTEDDLDYISEKLVEEMIKSRAYSKQAKLNKIKGVLTVFIGVLGFR
jgi:hypothetical protein